VKLCLGCTFQILFGFSYWPLRASNPFVAIRVSGALQQGFAGVLIYFNLIYLVVGLVLSHFICFSLKKQ
jgi:hypothetical protein